MKKLETLRILHMVKGGLTFLSTVGFFLVVSLQFKFLGGTNQKVGFLIIALLSLIPFALGIFNFITAGHIINRKNKTSIIVCSVLNCLSGALGLALGVYTIIEVSKKGFIEEEESLSLDDFDIKAEERRISDSDFVT